MRETTVPATPSTPAQRARYERVLRVATEMLRSGGEDNLQMKELSQRAEVSLATLYRYFPSKDHLLLAIALRRYEYAREQVSSDVPHGETVRERVTYHLLREFQAEQRDQKLTVAITRAMTETSRTYSDGLEQIEHAHLDVLRQVAEAGGPASDQQLRLLPFVIGAFGAATRRWLAGVSSAAEARFQIRTGCRLLDLPDSVIDEDLEQSAQVGNYAAAPTASRSRLARRAPAPGPPA